MPFEYTFSLRCKLSAGDEADFKNKFRTMISLIKLYDFEPVAVSIIGKKEIPKMQRVRSLLPKGFNFAKVWKPSIPLKTLIKRLKK